MESVDPFFVPTRSSLGKNVPHKIVRFQDRKKSIEDKNASSAPSKVAPSNVIDMKKARFEVYKFAQNSLQGEDKHKSKRDLAIKLGAKPPKNQYKNYRILKEELAKELEVAQKNNELYNIPIKHRISAHKSKLNKGALKRKRKIGSGILNVYGKVTKNILKK